MSGATSQLAGEFLSLFLGFEKAHGRYEILRSNERGKAEGKALTLRSPAAVEQWVEHLSGAGAGIGIIPLRLDNTCRWGALDVDQIGIDLVRLEQAVKQAALPLVVCRSKSGGAHLYCFFSEDVPADIVRDQLSKFSAGLGFGGCEVFPKQTHRIDVEQDMGNWINMPYFGGDETTRYALRDGVSLTPEEFIAYAREHSVTSAKFQSTNIPEKPDVDEWFEEAPPCLRTIYSSGGFPEGTRNNGMFNVGIYLRKRYKEDWEGKLYVYNEKINSPPLTHSEVQGLIKSINKKEYDYKCKEEPIRSFCNRSKCQKCVFGIGEAGSSGRMVEINSVTKYVGDPVIWYVELEGERLQLTTEDFISQPAFNKKVLDKLNIFPPTMPRPRWERYIAEKIAQADIVFSPEDASPEGQFRIMFKNYINGNRRAKQIEEVTRNIPFQEEDGTVYFRSPGLLSYLRNQGYKIKSEHHVWQEVRKLGGEPSQVWVNGDNIRVWKVSSKEPKGDD